MIRLISLILLFNLLSCFSDPFITEEKQLTHYINTNFPDKENPLSKKGSFLIIPNKGCKGCLFNAWKIYDAEVKNQVLVLTNNRDIMHAPFYNSSTVWVEPIHSKYKLEEIGFASFYPLLIKVKHNGEIKEILPLNHDSEEAFKEELKTLRIY